MSAAAEILTYAEQHQIQLIAYDGKLKVKAIEGRISKDFLQLAKDNKPELLVELIIREACNNLKITSSQFTTLCNKEDLELIRDGLLTMETLRAYATSFADGISTGRIAFHPITKELKRHN